MYLPWLKSSSVFLSDIKKERPPTPDDDVIVLSDNEPSSPCMNGVSHSFKKTDTEMLMVMSHRGTYLQLNADPFFTL